MLFDWREYLKIAEYLNDTANLPFSRESAVRCAISRAYYAVFGSARNYAIEEFGFQPDPDPKEKSKEHGIIRSLFRQNGRVRFARDLENLRIQRNLCDYDDSVINIDMIISNALPQARKLITQLQKRN